MRLTCSDRLVSFCCGSFESRQGSSVTDDALDDILSRVPISRRKFVRRVVLGSAFAVPFVASFEMGTLSAGAASAPNDCLVFNQNGSSFGDGTYTLVLFRTDTSPSPNVMVVTFYVQQGGRNVSSPELPVTLVGYTDFGYRPVGASGYEGYTPDLGTSPSGQPEPLQVPQRIPFRPSTTIHPPGYYQLILNTTQVHEAIYEPYAHSKIWIVEGTFSFKVGDDPHVIELPTNPSYTPAAFVSGPLCDS
jgi:hypothetical protein